MHVLIISRSYPNRINQSSGNFVLNQVEALAQHDIKIGVVGVYNVSLKEVKSKANISKFGFYQEKQKNITNYSYLYPVLPKLHFINHKIKFKIWKGLLKKYIVENGKPDIIHLHTFEAGELVMWAKSMYNIPFILTEHTSLFLRNIELEWHTKLANRVYKESSYNIAVSSSSAIFLEEKFGSSFNYLPNFVDTSRFTISKAKSNDVKRFINVAYLDANKNHKLLIDAFYKAFGNNPQFQLQIVGSGIEKKQLQNQTAKLGVNNIDLFGYADQDQIVDLYQNADYFVLSSNFETFGVVLIEAMSCGLAIVSTKCGGPESIVTNDKIGLLTPVKNEKLLAESMKNITKKDFDKEYIRNFAVDNYSYEALSKRLIDIYKDII